MSDGYPKEIWDIWPDDGGAPVLWREPCPFPVDDGRIIKYRRADLPATDAQAMQNEEVKALVEAAEEADILLSAMSDGRGVYERVIAKLRYALAAIKEADDDPAADS